MPGRPSHGLLHPERNTLVDVGLRYAALRLLLRADASAAEYPRTRSQAYRMESLKSSHAPWLFFSQSRRASASIAAQSLFMYR